jgi:hypothetical protein
MRNIYKGLAGVSCVLERSAFHKGQSVVYLATQDSTPIRELDMNEAVDRDIKK